VNEDFDTNDPNDADLRAAFDRLRHDTAQVNTMNALRDLEDDRGRNPWKTATLALGGGLAALLLVLGGLALRNNDEQVETGPADEGGGEVTESPTEAPGEEPTVEPTAAATPEPTTPEPTTPEATEPATPDATEAPSPEPTESPTAAPTEAPAAEVFVAIADSGLSLVPADGSTGPQLAFGTDQDTVLTGLQNALGPVTVEPGNPECGNQPDATARWAGLLSVEFRDNALIGWSLDQGSPLTTLTGIGLGSPVADLRRDYQGFTFLVGSSLGDEFVTQLEPPALIGLATGQTDTDSITNLWAGEVCIFR
jgi:hypothetical protein